MLIETDDEDSGSVKSDDEHDENDKQVLWNDDLEAVVTRRGSARQSCAPISMSLGPCAGRVSTLRRRRSS